MRDGNELSDDGGDDDLVRLSSVAETICEDFEASVVMCRDQCRLEHHVPQGTTTSGDGPSSAKDSAVVRGRGPIPRFRSLFASYGADLGHFGDQPPAGNRADPRDGTEDDDNLRQVIIARDGPSDS